MAGVEVEELKTKPKNMNPNLAKLDFRVKTTPSPQHTLQLPLNKKKMQVLPPTFLSISLFGTWTSRFLLEVLVHEVFVDSAHLSSTSAYATQFAQLACAPLIPLSS